MVDKGLFKLLVSHFEVFVFLFEPSDVSSILVNNRLLLLLLLSLKFI